ncbi:MAG: hypothetical protein K1X57_13435 [Gemmataceae bacterium]|nr:hypothetical protein [Gemmataceae bacterium]
MTMRLTDDIRRAVDASPNETVRLYDDRQDRAFVVVPEAVFEKLCDLADCDDYHHVTKAMCPGGIGHFM